MQVSDHPPSVMSRARGHGPMSQGSSRGMRRDPLGSVRRSSSLVMTSSRPLGPLGPQGSVYAQDFAGSLERAPRHLGRGVTRADQTRGQIRGPLMGPKLSPELIAPLIRFVGEC